jgi:predicted Zn-dependent protease
MFGLTVGRRDPPYNPPVFFSRLDGAAIGRSLAQIADRSGDLAESYFEYQEEVELAPEGGRLAVRREGGFAVRLLREGRSWIASADGFSGRRFGEALRQVARALPQATYPEPHFDLEPEAAAIEVAEMRALPDRLERAVTERRVAFPFALHARRHHREIQVIGTRLVPDPEVERFYSVAVRLPWGRWGSLVTSLSDEVVGSIAERLVAGFEAREAPALESPVTSVVLGPAAAAVLAHEAVAHTLECDRPVLGGDPEAAAGRMLGSAALSVLDDPSTAPEGVRRRTDDEGVPVLRRWLLRGGVVGQPLADRASTGESSTLEPGAARRSHRHCTPVPRSTHLEVVPGEAALGELLEGAELFLPEASWGRLDPYSGRFTVAFPFGRRVRAGELAEPVGACRLTGRVDLVLGAVAGVGSLAESTGAGWCAKGGQRLAVWATAPALRLDGVEVGG